MFVHYATLFDKCECFWRPTFSFWTTLLWYLRNTVHRLFSGHCAILSTDYSIATVQYCPHTIQSPLGSTVRRLFSGHCALLFKAYSVATVQTLDKDYSLGTAQCCAQTIQWQLRNTVHRLFNDHCAILSTNYALFLSLHNISSLIWVRIYYASFQYWNYTANNIVQ